MCDYFVFYERPYIMWTKGSKNDDYYNKVWNAKFSETEQSTVGIRGNNEYRPDLRHSTSLREQFEAHCTDMLQCLFSKYKTGVGSKHIYVTNDFIKPHRDQRLPDFEGLPHAATMVVYNLDGYSGGDLLINGKDVLKERPSEKRDWYGPRYVTVIFTLDCVHEVTTITQGIRQAFVFPIYGNYDPSGQLVKKLYSKNVKDVVQLVRQKVKDFNPTDDYALAKLQSAVEVLQSDQLNRMVVRYRLRWDDWVPSERRHDISSDDEDDDHYIKVSYLDKEKQLITSVTSDTLYTIPDGSTDIKIYCRVSEQEEEKVAQETFLNNLYTELDKYESEFNQIIQAVNNKSIKYPPITDFPCGYFIVSLKGIYYEDSNINNLCPVDKWLYEQLTSREVKFVTGKEKNITFPLYQEQDGKLVLVEHEQEKEKDTEPYRPVDDLYCEFDDQGGYDPRYNRVNGILVVSPLQK